MGTKGGRERGLGTPLLWTNCRWALPDHHYPSPSYGPRLPNTLQFTLDSRLPQPILIVGLYAVRCLRLRNVIFRFHTRVPTIKKTIEKLPDENDDRSCNGARGGNNQTTDIARGIYRVLTRVLLAIFAELRRTLSSKQLIAREVCQLDAHNICCKSHGTLVICHFGCEPSSIDCLYTTHSHLCPNNTAWAIKVSTMGPENGSVMAKPCNLP